MRIVSTNTCAECCYCMEDYGGFGVCCKDNQYRNISINKHACKYFCNDGENYGNIEQSFNEFDVF